MKSKTLGLVAVGLLALPATAFAVQSTFETGFDGWTQTSGVTHSISGGAGGGGYLEFNDAGPADGGTVVAPNSFLGNWLALYGAAGTVSVDYTLIRAGSIEPFPMWLKITGSGGEIGRGFAPAADFAKPFDWRTFSTTLEPVNWVLISGTFNGALSNVTELRVFMPSASSADEITGIDNVIVSATPPTVVPEPGTLALLGLGLAGLSLSRRRKA